MLYAMYGQQLNVSRIFILLPFLENVLFMFTNLTSGLQWTDGLEAAGAPARYRSHKSESDSSDARMLQQAARRIVRYILQK